MSQRVELILSCVNDTRKAIQEVVSSFQGMAAKISVLNYAIRSSYQGVKEVLDVVVFRTARLGEELLIMSQKTGMGVQAIYDLKNTAELSNISLGELNVLINVLSRNIFEARNRAGDARAVFKALGVDTARPLSQIINDLAKRFSEMEDSEDKMALAMQLFGRSGANIIPLLNDIASGAKGASTIFDEELARSSEELSDNFTLLKQNIEGVSIAVGGQLIPALNQLFDDIETRSGLTGLLIKQFEDMWNAAKWATKPLFDISKMAGDALDNLLGYNKALAETQRFITNAPTKVGQLEFAFPPAFQNGKSAAPQIITDEQRRKFVDNEENMVKLVDDASNKIIDSLNKRAQGYEELAKRSNASREAEINLQLRQIDLAEQEFRISKSDAVQERIRLQRELLAIQEEYLVTLDKSLDPASWYAQQNAINDTRSSLVQLNLALKEQTGTMTEGVSQGFRQFLHDANTTFQLGAQLAQDTAQAMQSSFDTFFFDMMEGQLDSLEDYLLNFLESIERALSSVLSQMATQGLLSMAGGFFSPQATSEAGVVVHKGGYIPRFHVGGLAADEIPAILQRGEYVVSRKGVDALDRINQGKGAAAPNVIINIANQTGQQVGANQDSPRFDGEKYIVNIVLKNIDKNGHLRNALAGLK